MVSTALFARARGGPLARPKKRLHPDLALVVQLVGSSVAIVQTEKRDVVSHSEAEILPPQAVREDVAVVLAYEADVIILDNRSLAKGERVEITMAEAEEAEALIEGEVAPNMSSSRPISRGRTIAEGEPPDGHTPIVLMSSMWRTGAT
ncbi:uncharacterized protein A4U43_C10F10070 [Asparagus officinalis]|uniref:Uncharacterized protein n=1 Tax=Asparagus officinalis TaxID=4686 RepID=A0A5P1E1T8_ASPOF|nr:uncharacterized protein A4U43_C10F10070 [Asparagus officinalis]